jgi:sulfur carrier protein ThiS
VPETVSAFEASDAGQRTNEHLSDPGGYTEPCAVSGHGERSRYGAEGRVADLVLLEANPLDDVGNTRRIAAVVMNGRFLPREWLDKTLAAAEAAALRY